MSETEQYPFERVKASDGDLVLDFPARVGARPYARYVDGEWELMSLTHVPTPSYGEPDDSDVGHDTRVHVVDLEPDPDEWSEDDLRDMAEDPRYPHEGGGEFVGVEVVSVDETPFDHREDIPSKDEIVRVRECPACSEEYREYVPDPQSECPHCGTRVEQRDEERDDR